ncbi:hypothetical protein QTP88_025978 [Uroleucon formosanum]
MKENRKKTDHRSGQDTLRALLYNYWLHCTKVISASDIITLCLVHMFYLLIRTFFRFAGHSIIDIHPGLHYHELLEGRWIEVMIYFACLNTIEPNTTLASTTLLRKQCDTVFQYVQFRDNRLYRLRHVVGGKD